MKIKYLYILSLISLLAFSSCETLRYGMANVSEPTSFTAKPVYNDTSSIEKKATYVSGEFADSGDGAYQPDDRSSFFTGKVYSSVVRKAFDYSYGAYAYYGTYDVQNVQNFNGKKGFHGFGIFHEGNARIGKRVKWLHIGYRVNLWYEGGEFDQFRRDADQFQNFDNLHPQKVNVYLGFQQKFVLFENFGTYYNVGGIWRMKNPEATPLIGGGLFLSYDCCAFDIGANISPELAYLNFAFHYKLSK